VRILWFIAAFLFVLEADGTEVGLQKGELVLCLLRPINGTRTA